MGAATMLTLLLTHPLEFRTLVQFWLWHDKNRDITSPSEYATSGWDRESMRRCWHLLDLTSRSFSAVIKELEGDLARVICLFYLVLRGLDTIEDDMTIPDHIKQSLLRTFHEKTETPGWTFDGNGPDEKDRQLLVEYDVVVEELNRLQPEYREVIIDICHKMETGMADYAHVASSSSSKHKIYLATVAEYDLYCHYVAGLVGEGLSRLWSASGKEAPWLQYQLELSNSMGLLLQKTNIIRDYREDVDGGRYFWPKEIWASEAFADRARSTGEKDSGAFKEMRELYDPKNERRALWVQTAMVVDALRHAEDSLDYLSVLKNQSVFNFCAIPATMALATLELCFMNAEMFKRNIKIRKAEAAKLIMASKNPRDVAYLFRDYARKMHARAQPADPNFLRISVACGKIEQWCERHYPSFVQVSPTSREQVFDPADARSRVVELEQKRDHEIAIQKRLAARSATAANGQHTDALNPLQDEAQSPKEILMYVTGAFILLMTLTLGVIWTVLWFTGDMPNLGVARLLGLSK